VRASAAGHEPSGRLAVQQRRGKAGYALAHGAQALGAAAGDGVQHVDDVLLLLRAAFALDGPQELMQA
jgi:hypothetical protein